MVCPCCAPQKCDCLTLGDPPFPLPPGKTGISLQLTLKPKVGYAAHYHEDGTITDLEGDALVEMPLAGPSGPNDYGNEGLCYFFNSLTGEVDCTFTGGGAFLSNLSVGLRCWRGGGPPKQGQFYIGIQVNNIGFGYREDGEWVWTRETPNLTSFAAEAWFDPVVVDGTCQAWDQTVLHWPEDFSFSSPSYACDDLGICAELRFVYS